MRRGRALIRRHAGHPEYHSTAVAVTRDRREKGVVLGRRDDRAVSEKGGR